MSEREDRCVIVLTTAGSAEQAELLARGLVERRLAACVHVLGDGYSYYRWRGEQVREAERQLIVKTTEGRLTEVGKAIQELHTYEVPEFLAIPIADGDPAYLDWLRDAVRLDGS